jgi:hypothetical protein
MDLGKLDGELNVKIIESLKEILKNKNAKINFENATEEILEASKVQLKENYFRLFKKLVINEVDDLNPKYKRFISKKILNEMEEMNQPQSVNHIRKRTKYLFFLRPFLGKKIIKNEIRSIVFRLNYNAIIIELKKIDYDRLNFYTKYVYKLQQLHKLNIVLGINQEFSVVFDDDQAAKNMYDSMYNNLGDIIKPPDKD